jgi:hypothetical protein
MPIAQPTLVTIQVDNANQLTNDALSKLENQIQKTTWADRTRLIDDAKINDQPKTSISNHTLNNKIPNRKKVNRVNKRRRINLVNTSKLLQNQNQNLLSSEQLLFGNRVQTVSLKEQILGQARLPSQTKIEGIVTDTDTLSSTQLLFGSRKQMISPGEQVLGIPRLAR